ncbi:MAG: protein TolR [Endozoicomonadaceae bacterium]|nr:protein TolR [Endozoicomonadaceae bacterium]
MKLRTRRKPMSEINMVPFIDIMMVMLVAFMVATPMMSQGIKVQLPKANSTPIKVPKGKVPLIVSVKADGSYYLNLESAEQSAQSLKVISQHVAKIKGAQPNTMVLIEGDERVNYGKIVAAMVSLQDAGVYDVGLMTDPRELN